MATLKTVQCANFKLTGCQNLVLQRGSILCEECLEIRKTNSKIKVECEVGNLETTIHSLKNEKKTLQATIEALEDKVKILEAELKQEREKKEKKESYDGYKTQLEKEIFRMKDMLSKQYQEKDTLVKDKNYYEMTFNQLKLDNERHSIENERIKLINTDVSIENSALRDENEKLQNEVARLELLLKVSSNVSNIGVPPSSLKDTIKIPPKVSVQGTNVQGTNAQSLQNKKPIEPPKNVKQNLTLKKVVKK